MKTTKDTLSEQIGQSLTKQIGTLQKTINILVERLKEQRQLTDMWYRKVHPYDRKD